MLLNAQSVDNLAHMIYVAFHEAFHRGELGLKQIQPYLDALNEARRNPVS